MDLIGLLNPDSQPQNSENVSTDYNPFEQPVGANELDSSDSENATIPSGYEGSSEDDVNDTDDSGIDTTRGTRVATCWRYRVNSKRLFVHDPTAGRT